MVSRCNVWMIWIEVYWKNAMFTVQYPTGSICPVHIHTHTYIHIYIFLPVHINIWATTMYVNCYRSHSMIWFYSPITTNIFPRSMVCLVLWLKEQITGKPHIFNIISLYINSWLGHIWWWTNLVSGCFWLIFRYTNNRKMLCIKSLLAQFVRKHACFPMLFPLTILL